MDAVIINSVNRFCTSDKADEIESFFKENPLPSSDRRFDFLNNNYNYNHFLYWSLQY